MPLHFKTGDGDLLIITEPALLARCAWQSHAIYCAALAWSIRIVIGIGRSHDKKSVLGIGCKNPDRSIPTTRYFIFNFSIIFFIFIENKYLSDVIWDLKRERKSLAKGRIKLRSIGSKKAYATGTNWWWASFVLLTSPVVFKLTAAYPLGHLTFFCVPPLFHLDTTFLLKDTICPLKLIYRCIFLPL